VLAATERLGAVTHLVSSLEYLARERDREWGGANNWAATRAGFGARWPLYGRLLDVVGDRRVTRGLHVARVAAAAALWLPLPPRARAVANGVLPVSQLLLHTRHLYGSDGADQVAFLTQALSAIGRAGRNQPRLVDACLWFIALQSVLSYTVSGWAKLPSETWRSGRALPGITRTRTYGDRAVWQLMDRFPKLTRTTAHGVLALECGFPAVFLGRGRLAPPVLLAAATFHLVNARVMGLGRFFWSFLSTYPAVLYATGPKAVGPVRRDDTLPAVCLFLAATTMAAGQVARVRRARVVAAGRGDERRFTTSSGNELSYRLLEHEDPSRPLLIVESGLVATTEHWEWLVGSLSERFAVLTYNRAGYGPSRHRDRDAYCLDRSRDDLVELVTALDPSRPCVLVGHSLGGYLAMRAARPLGARVSGLVLVDSSHPAELQRSPTQARGAEALTRTLALMPASLRAGLGWLLRRPPWVDRMPPHVRALALAQYRDAGMWAAAVREWQATKAHFDGFDGDLPQVGVPMLVISAGATVTNDPEHARLHEELAAAAPRAEQVVLSGVDHDEVLTNPAAADQVAGLITRFVAGLLPADTNGIEVRHATTR
jgi:pimeloyl-ACP methyl ester carboxylesterase